MADAVRTEVALAPGESVWLTVNGRPVRVLLIRVATRWNAAVADLGFDADRDIVVDREEVHERKRRKGETRPGG